jgi:nucleotide-binding universal stress UspA family protein
MRVLIAYDGGEAGDKALAAIAPWTRASAAEVHLVKVLKPKDIHETSFPGPAHAFTPAGTASGQMLNTAEPPPHLASNRGQAFDTALAEAADQLRAIGEHIFGQQHAEAHVEISDEPARSIVDLASQIGADVIAIGTHSRTGLQRAILGSVAEEVVRRALMPVLVVGPQVRSN